jgi:dihydroxyacetone kinase-like predicted kinase
MEAPTGGGVDLAVVRRFVDVAVDALSAAREEIDALNVYPVPDGDTGTNMYLTMSAARDAIQQAAADGADLLTALGAFRRAALLGARGNSGVILSQLLGALVARIGRAQPGERNATVMAEAMVEATDAAYAAVGMPVEGTILTVARAAADAAVRRAEEERARARDVFAAAAEAAREALVHTPEQLEQLRAAGVVDAGGRGLSVILDAAETVLTGRHPIAAPHPIGTHTIPVA